ncbi:HEPN domain-containing protein [Serratia silvae]|uniref:Apea-like HEPN domain-containing protein n=1 Tax=Serratia silvae TaxID=2824122 RepID=A0ABT0KIK7_9GAMM|nr:HEPN domain-containing protein [Serratia silvae]MCL1031865.1 hypothetical protein [Serratia silvae]
MKLSGESKKKFVELLEELARSYKLWLEDKDAFYKGIQESNIFTICIDAPIDLQAEMLKKWEDKTPCIYQLYHSTRSLNLTRELSGLIHKNNNLHCLAEELNKIIEAIVYEYANFDLDDVEETCSDNEKYKGVKIGDLQKIGERRIDTFKKEFSRYVFHFPVTIFNFDKELQLSENIGLIPIKSMGLDSDELSIFKKTRPNESNYYLEVRIQNKCSKLLALHLAGKAKEATYNILKLLATRLSPQAIPLLASHEIDRHRLDFYKYGKNTNNMERVTTLKFDILHYHSEHFWKGFIEGRMIENNLIDLSMQIPELLLLPSATKQRVVERIERSLLWYGDAVTESNWHQQIQKLVSSLEALVNFDEDDTTETFKRRVTNLNINRTGLDDIVRDKARQLYNVRSKIVHGSSLDEKLHFCPIEFCSKTLVGAIFYLSIFGFSKTDFNIKMPDFLDKIPERAILDETE